MPKPKERAPDPPGPPRRFQVAFAAEVRKDLKKLGKSAAQEILRQIAKKLTVDPIGHGDALYRDLGGYRKLRVGEHRVIYRVVEDRVLVIVLGVGKRAAGCTKPRHRLSDAGASSSSK
ncbi:MAG: type II toxin-antitoxin system RelE/ParE family toxin [Gemmatimonadetes bacterium]|nr:type II toxin-antitoxin system RelE/ParE family toxin [Gemmatimonadota bacterium]